MLNIYIGRAMALFLFSTWDSHRLVYGLGPVGAAGVILCCVSLPQSQGTNSKNSVVSSSSTKDSSMSSSAPMVPHLYLVSLTLLFYGIISLFPSFKCLVLSPPHLFLSHPIFSEIFSVLRPLPRPLSSASLLLFWTQTVMLEVDLMILKLND